MIFRQKTRSRFDDTSEFAAKQLPAHPISRYSTFSPTWKCTRQKGGYVPTPKNNQEEFFPCCLTCQSVGEKTSKNQAIWRKTANVQWLRAEWKWDFGHLLPEGLIAHGVGVSFPTIPPERDRLFILDTATKDRNYLEIDLEAHAQIKSDQHDARIKIVDNQYQGGFEGQLTANTSGVISVGITDTTSFGDPINLTDITMPYDLTNLLRYGDSIKVTEGKVFIKGVQV